MKELVKVTSIASGGVWVEGMQSSACSSCQAKSGCGQESLKKLGKPVSLWVPTNKTLRVGEQAMVELPEGAVALSALALYGVPLCGLAGGAVAGQLSGLPEWQVLLAAGIGLGIGFAIAKRLANRYKQQWQPRLVGTSQCLAVEQII